MIVDFILLWSASLALIKLGIKNDISAENAGLLFFGVVLVITITKKMGSNAFRERSRIPKFFCPWPGLLLV